MTDEKLILSLIHEELDRANKIYPLFHSGHEAQNVIREELEEAEYELKMCEDILESMRIKIKCDIDYTDNVNELKGRSIKLIQEAIQVAAMCDKALESMKNYKQEKDKPGTT